MANNPLNPSPLNNPFFKKKKKSSQGYPFTNSHHYILLNKNWDDKLSYKKNMNNNNLIKLTHADEVHEVNYHIYNDNT